MSGQRGVKKSLVAGEIPFDNDTNGFVSDEVQSAIEEVNDQVAQSASPGFTWGKGGSAGPGEYLLNDDVESNKSGRLVPFDGAVAEFFVNNEKSSGNKTLELRRRRPCQTGPWTTIDTVTVPAGEECMTMATNTPVLEGDELSIRVSNSSADFENPIVGIVVKNETSGTAGGGVFLETLDEGVSIEPTTVSLDFTGAGVTATTDGVGNVTVDIPGGGAGSGEANTASNVGSGADVFKQKTGVDLEFRGILGANGITATVNGDNVEVALDNAPDLDVNKVTQGIDTAGGQVVTGGADVTYATTLASSVATISGTTITIQKDGFYKVHYDITNEGTSSSRSESQAELLEDTGGGFTVIPGTNRRMYHRTTAQGKASASATVYRSYTVGDEVKLNSIRTAGGAPIQTVSNGTVLDVTYLRDSN